MEFLVEYKEGKKEEYIRCHNKDDLVDVLKGISNDAAISVWKMVKMGDGQRLKRMIIGLEKE